MTPDFASLIDRLNESAARLAEFQVVAGFDGFVDEMISVVDQRQTLSRFKPVDTIGQFAGLIQGAAGKSSLREIVITGIHAGGCAVNLGDGLLALGIKLDYFGTLGTPIHAAFEPFARACRSCHSWGSQPGRTLALEFQDGKYMLSAVSQLAEFDPDLLDRVLADGAYLDACRKASLIAITDWTLYPHMTECWKKLQREVFSKLDHRPRFFVDLVDPRGRSVEDIRAMLEVLKGFEAAGPLTLGGNLNEANAIASALDISTAEEEPEALMRQAESIRRMLGIDEVVTHCLKSAAMAGAEGVTFAQGPFCPRPIKSTGAGDRFNAGYCVGHLLDVEPTGRLTLGKAGSGYFVRHARSAAVAELVDFLRRWERGDLD
ncbi:MAG: hypothetical protein JJU36_11365 [Phycisphaeraceae bacterium]|nr:hypothetical protein [Phycisphaeraceae bacterium]